MEQSVSSFYYELFNVLVSGNTYVPFLTESSLASLIFLNFFFIFEFNFFTEAHGRVIIMHPSI